MPLPDRPYTITGAPRIVKDKVVIGNGGAEYGVRGYVTAYNTETGAQEWRFYTVPGNPADGFESEAMREAAKHGSAASGGKLVVAAPPGFYGIRPGIEPGIGTNGMPGTVTFAARRRR